MKKLSINPPVALTLSALDPSGTGGIQADIETAVSLGCHCAPVIACSFASATAPNCDVISTDSALLIEQTRSTLDIMDVRAIKLGFLGSLSNLEAVHSILDDFSHIPVISQPSFGLIASNESPPNEYVDAFKNLILPQCHIVSLPLNEARALAGESDTIDTTAHALLSTGCSLAFIMGTGKQNAAMQNSLYDNKGLIKQYPWGEEAFSCQAAIETINMAMAAYIAHGFDERQVIEQAQSFTLHTINAARDLGNGRRTPHRLFWADKNIQADQDKQKKFQTH